MPALADLQRRVRHALVIGETSSLASMLVGGRDPNKRLAIHQRHYEASLVNALVGRFPATVWLIGSLFVTAAAREFVHTRPPSRPCIADYGESFPTFLATRLGAKEDSYFQQFAELEWHVSRLALAVDRPSLDRRALSTMSGAPLDTWRIGLQPGVTYLSAAWAIDELIAVYWSSREPDRFYLQRSDVWLELRGSRGELSVKRLTRGDFTFRARLAGGHPLTDAAVSALKAEESFDAGQALLRLIDDELVVAMDSIGGHV